MKFFLALGFLLNSVVAISAVPEKKSIQLLKDPNGQKLQVSKNDVVSLEKLEAMFSLEGTPGHARMLKQQTLVHRQKAVPLLINVMKDAKYPDSNRWIATMLLGQVMGRKAAPFIAKFNDHPHWMMRLASLKALLGLRMSDYHAVYSKALRDPSLIVRVQALENISQMNLAKLGPNVWNMMYDSSNYSGSSGTFKRTSIVKSIIRTLGDIKYAQASRPLARLIQKPKYQDLVEDLDYSLEKMTGTASPNSNIDQRRKFWSKLTAANTKKI